MAGQTVAVSIPASYTPSNDMVTVGQNIRRLREAKGWTQPDLAARMEVTQPSVSKVEAGDNPGILTLIKFAIALQCAVEDLIDSVDEEYTALRKHLPAVKAVEAAPALTRSQKNLLSLLPTLSAKHQLLLGQMAIALTGLSATYGPKSRPLGGGGKLPGSHSQFVGQIPEEPTRRHGQRRIKGRDV